jgi:hypothetical protein
MLCKLLALSGNGFDFKLQSTSILSENEILFVKV